MEETDRNNITIDHRNVIKKLQNSYSLNFDELYMEVDGNFPNHPADPSDPANLRELKEYIISKNTKSRFRPSSIPIKIDVDIKRFLD